MLCKMVDADKYHCMYLKYRCEVDGSDTEGYVNVILTRVFHEYGVMLVHHSVHRLKTECVRNDPENKHAMVHSVKFLKNRFTD